MSSEIAVPVLRGKGSLVFRFEYLAFLLVMFALVGAKGEDQFFDSNGVRIRYVVEGKGAPVVLIHGMTLDVESQWDEAGIRKALATNYQVIAFDLRGHGKSGKPHEASAYGVEMVEDVRRLLDHLHIKKAHVVGYSLGGTIALKFVTMYPERCLSVVIGEGAVYHERYDFSAEDEAARNSAAVSDPAQVMPKLPPGTPADAVRRRDAWVKMPHDFRAYAAIFQSLKALKVADVKLEANRVPVLGLFCRSGDQSEYLTMRLSNFKAGFVGGSHRDAYLRPEFLAKVKDFLNAQAMTQKPSPRGVK